MAGSPYSSVASRSQIDKAGRRLRDAWNDPLEWRRLVVQGDMDEPWDVAWRFRAELQTPLTKVVMGLRSMVRTTGSVDAPVGQRLKRMPTILYKLGRYPNMNLTTMQDIAGCRVILPDQDAVHRLQRRIHQNSWEVRETYDYAADPKPDGYRAIHVVVVRDNRLVEIQLRTLWQHAWARNVESIDLVFGHGLKEGGGPEVLRQLLERSAYAVAVTRDGSRMPPEFDKEFDVLRARAARYLRRGRSV